MNGEVRPPPAPVKKLTWDSKRSGKGVKTKSSDRVALVSSSSEGWHTARSKQGLSGGTHYVEIEVRAVAETSNTWKVVVGAVPPQFDCRAPSYTCVGSSQGGWGYVGGTGCRYCRVSGPDTPYGPAYAAGDTVGMLLDFPNGTVTFFRNRVCLGPAFANLAGTAHVAVAQTGKGGSVELRYVGSAPPFRYSAEFVRYPAQADGVTDAERHARLEADFGFKLPERKLDMETADWAAPLQELTAMGFSMMDCAEALLVSLPTGVRGAAADESGAAMKQGVQLALDYLLAGPDARKPKYEVAANSYLRHAPPAVQVGGKPAAGGLADRVALLTSRLEEEQKMRAAERESAANDVYRAVLGSVVAKGTVTKEDERYLEQLRKQRGLPASAHARLLADLGLDKSAYKAMLKLGRANEEALRKSKKLDAKAKSKGKMVEVAEDRECIVCLENPRDMVILNCMHVCVCETCADEYRKDGAECPTCRRAVDEVRKVYW